MAFSEETLKPIFDQIKQSYYYKDDQFIQNVSFAHDYLTGNTNTLPTFIYTYGNSGFSEIAKLFIESDSWTNNDDLLISLCLEPTLNASAKTRFPLYFLALLNSPNQEKGFNKVLTIFKKLHFTSEEILSRLISSVKLPDDSTKIDRKLPYIKYILDGLGNAPQGFINTLATPHIFFHYSWNKNAFAYLELIDPKKAEDFLKTTLHNSDSHRQKGIIEEILQKDFKKFFPFVNDLINKSSSDTLENAQAKFHVQFYCYVFNPNKNLNEIVENSEVYLRLYTSNPNNKYHETYINFREGEFSKYRKLSTWAFYFVTQQNKVEGLNWLTKMFANKIPLHQELVEFISQEYPSQSMDFLIQALQSETAEYSKREYYSRIIELLKQFPAEEYLLRLWDMEKYKAKTTKEIVSFHLAQFDPQAVSRAIPLLNHKKADIRLMAVHILNIIGSTEAIKALGEALDKEKNDDARDAMLYSLADSFMTEFSEENIKDLITKANDRGKLAKPIVDWLDESQLPPIFLKSGRQLSSNEIRFIFYRMSRVKEMRIDPEAKSILNFIDRDKSTEFAKKIFKLYGEHGYDVKLKSLLTIAALTGNHEIVDKLRTAINDWIEVGRKVMSEYGIGALALQGSDKALRWVEWYSRKYKSKKAYVGETALAALQNASEELSITIHELGDRVIPDFGFDGLFKNFTAGNEEFRAFIDSKFKLAFFNEDNKKIKSVPASTSEELKEEFKNIAKEVKDIVKSQSTRLEHYLTVQRKWSQEAWKKSFLENPVMFIYATKILWCVFKDDKIQNYFICQEDTTLTDVNDEEISIEDDCYIIMAHPYYLSEQELKSWQQKFFDLSIEPIFPQLERVIARVPENDKERKIILEFQDAETENSTIKSTLEKRGWGKGATGDGGYVDDFVKDDYDSGIQAMIEVTGVFVGGYGNDYEPKLGRLYFIDKKIKKGNNTWFSPPKDDSDERLIALKNIPPVFYSEIIADIKAIKLKNKDIKNL